MVFFYGNKIDIKKRQVKTEVAKDWAKGRGYKFFEASAKTGINVNEALPIIPLKYWQ